MPLLAALNRELIEDEGHHNTLTLAGLEARLRGWLGGACMATIFTRDDRVVACAVWREASDFVYLRHFFVIRGYRREGVGREAIRLLLEEVWPAETRVRVEALVGNRAALGFRRAVGFLDYEVALEMERGL